MDAQRWLLVGSSALLAILSIPLILGVVPPNDLYGFRTALTRSSPDVWYRANVFAGWALFVAAAISMVVLFMLPATAERWVAPVILAAPLLAAVGASFMYLRRLG